MRRRARLTASLILALVAGPASAFDIVYDPTAVAKLVDQVQQMEKQLTTLNDKLDQANRVYTANPGNAFYATELDRIARQTGTNHSIGQAVYDTAARRVDELDKLRQQIGQARDVKDVLDLSARVQVESTLLQNDVLRMQGLAMVQPKSRTVLQFLEDPAVLDEAWARCRNDPGGIGDTPDCRNAGHAKERIMMLGRERAIQSLKS